MVKVIAELSINHLGMKKIAIATIERCKEIGADYIKLKKKKVGKYYKAGKKWRGYDFVDYRRSLELSKEDFVYIDEYCKYLDIPWFSTVHDLEGLDFIAGFDPPFYKVASMDAKNPEFLSWFVKNVPSNRPVIVSTGGMSMPEIDSVVTLMHYHKLQLILNHCVSIYPTPVNQTNIGMITELKDTFDNVTIGYSGHEVGWMPTLVAVLLGAEFVERHVTLSKDLKIHHIDAGLTTDEFKNMVQDIRHVEEVQQAKSKEYNLEELNFLLDRDYK